jgi:DNA-binding transcriptional regulator PaaX
MMEDREPSQPETWRGDLTALMVQFGIPGGLIQKVVSRTKTAGRLKKAVEKIKNNKLKKVSTVSS